MDYKKKIEENFSDQLDFLSELLKVNSENDEPVSFDDRFYPFGEGVQKCFETFLDKSEDIGFSVKNVDNYGGHVDFGDGEKILGIIGHLDVVPATGDWQKPPYSGFMDSEFIYGRGTTDDKGPIVACLFAMKALRDSGYIPAKKIRLILGLDEETDWNGLDYYLSREEMPDFGFTPDGDFPVVNGEKGILTFELARKLGKPGSVGTVLRKLEGGSAPNMVPDKAVALINNRGAGKYDDVVDKITAYSERTGYKLNYRVKGKSFEITANGVSAHGADPELGLNAISILMDFLRNINFADDRVNDFIEFYNEKIGFDLHATKLGCDAEDEESGRLTFNSGMIKMEKKCIVLAVNVRYPVFFSDESFYQGLSLALKNYDIGVVKKRHEAPIFIDLDNSMVKQMLDSYEKFTGESAKPIVMGGGTYSRAFKNMLAFGAKFPDDENLMHMENEKLSIEKFKLMTEIYADAIYKLSCESFVFE